MIVGAYLINAAQAVPAMFKGRYTNGPTGADRASRWGNAECRLKIPAFCNGVTSQLSAPAPSIISGRPKTVALTGDKYN
jgi:hypothetical protein